MTRSSSPRGVRRRWQRAARAALGASALGLASGVLVGGAPAASAHDSLASSSPGADSVVATAPEAVSLTFGGRPQGLGATVVVADASGTDWVADAARVEGRVVQVPLRSGLPDGNYQVRWRIVSADGAVISGFFDFGVGDVTGAPEVSLPTSNGSVSRSGGDFDLAEPAAAASSSHPRGSTPWRTASVAAAGALGALALLGAYRLFAGPPPPPRSPNPTRQEQP